MSRHNSSDYDWNQTDSDLPAHIRERLLYNQLPSRRYKYTLWENIKDLILVALLLAVFTSPLWMTACGIAINS